MQARPCRLAISAIALLAASSAWANHPVLVEGNCDSPVPGTTSVPFGTCGDFDGDGRIGAAEDTDGLDRIFGTINAALGAGTGPAAGTGANQNGQVTIVASGRFPEVVNIAATGNVTLQAAPGVEAIIDAVVQGVPGNAGRQNAPGIVIESPANRYVILRNLTVRNWSVGIRVTGSSRVSIENVRVENNSNIGIRVRGASRVKIDESNVLATGFRASAATGGGDFPGVLTPNPGAGIVFDGQSSGAVFRTEVAGNFGAGIADQSSGTVTAADVYEFDNNAGATP